MKRILVTGGLGFIGTHLVHCLLEEGNIIDIVDNLANPSTTPEEFKSNNIRNIYTCSVEEFSFENKYDQIYHLASPVGPAGVLEYAGRMGKMILNDDLKVAEYAHKNNSKVLFVSTSEVYGRDPGQYAQSEDIDKVVPAKITTRLEYGAAKLLAEICIHNFAKHHKLEYIIVRPFNIVGVGQSSKAGFVLPRFVYGALLNKPITVFGSGKQRRTFTHVKDIVSAIKLLMDSPISGEIFNIGNPANEYSIQEIAQFVKELTNSTSEIINVNPKDIYGKDYEEAWNKIPDISKITTMTEWRPKYLFKDIIQEVIDDYKQMFALNKLRPNQEYKDI